MPVKSMQGLVVAAHGRHYMVELADGSVRRCYPRGKRLQAAVGDHVVIEPAGKEEGRITAILERRNLLYRSDDVRSKQFAANIDQLLFVVAVDPSFSLDLIGRALVAAWHADIVPIIILNKIDLTHSVAHARSRLEWLKELDVPVIELSALDAVDTRARLFPGLYGKTCFMVGHISMDNS